MYNSPNSFFQLSTVLCKFLSVTVRYKIPYMSLQFSTFLYISSFLYNSLQSLQFFTCACLYNSPHSSTILCIYLPLHLESFRIVYNSLGFHPPILPQCPRFPHIFTTILWIPLQFLTSTCLYTISTILYMALQFSIYFWNISLQCSTISSNSLVLYFFALSLTLLDARVRRRMPCMCTAQAAKIYKASPFCR